MYRQENPYEVIRVGDTVLTKDNNVHRKGVVLKIVYKPFMRKTRPWAVVRFDWGEETILAAYLRVLRELKYE